MIRIFGPQYRYRGEILTQPAIIYLDDHYRNEPECCLQIDKLLSNSACDPQQHLVIIEGLGHDDRLAKYNPLIFPRFVSLLCQQFDQQKIQPDWSKKTVNFNFMINKPRLHRNFLLMLINHFELTNYCYSLPWQQNHLGHRDLLRLTDNSYYKKIIANNTKTVIPGTDYRFGSENVLDQGLQNGGFSNQMTYDKLLRTTVFEPSCVSLITETLFREQETRVSEKTIMAMWGGTIPIWVGGWRHADRLKALGFDLFDDIVDHSYQDLPDPLDRCYYAVERNLDLLRDPDLAQQFVKNNQLRFQHNLSLCQKSVFFDYLVKQIKKHDLVTQLELNLLKGTQKHIKWKAFTQLNPDISISLNTDTWTHSDIEKFQGFENLG